VIGRTIATGVALCILAGLVIAGLTVAAGAPIGWAGAVVGAAISGTTTGWFLVRS
jgi:hypothetical protein